jgi:hypothetical protein
VDRRLRATPNADRRERHFDEATKRRCRVGRGAVCVKLLRSANSSGRTFEDHPTGAAELVRYPHRTPGPESVDATNRNGGGRHVPASAGTNVDQTEHVGRTFDDCGQLPAIADERDCARPRLPCAGVSAARSAVPHPWPQQARLADGVAPEPDARPPRPCEGSVPSSPHFAVRSPSHSRFSVLILDFPIVVVCSPTTKRRPLGWMITPKAEYGSYPWRQAPPFRLDQATRSNLQINLAEAEARRIPTPGAYASIQRRSVAP